MLLGRDKQRTAVADISIQPGAEGVAVIQAVETAGGDEDNRVSRCRLRRKVGRKRVVRLAQRGQESRRLFGKAVPKDGDARGAAENYILAAPGRSGVGSLRQGQSALSRRRRVSPMARIRSVPQAALEK